MKKKICMIVQDPMVRGGIATVVNGYRASKLETDYDVIYIESYKDGAKLTKLLKAIRGYVHFLKVLFDEKPDLIHIHSSFGPSFFRKIPFIYMASWCKLPIINHIHGSDFDAFYNNASAVKKEIVKRVYLKCRVLIALSDAGREEISKIIPAEKIVIVENYSIMHKDGFEERMSRHSNSTVLYLGEIGKRKGCYDIPAVVEQVARVIPDVRFIIGGSGEIDNIKELLSERNIQKNVEFPGWGKRPLKKISYCEKLICFFLPSYYEGMPMSILEAMGYGLPIVSTDVGGISKIVRNGENGYLCKAGEVMKLSEAIISLLQDTSLANTYGKNSFQIVENEYTLESHLIQIEKIYSNL